MSDLGQFARAQQGKSKQRLRLCTVFGGFGQCGNRRANPALSLPAMQANAMAKMDETTKLSWPWWAPWALLAVAATSLLPVAATLYDIL